MLQRAVWHTAGSFRVSSEVFLDIVYTEKCDCTCPFCIARIPDPAEENRSAWEQALRDAFRLFPIRNVILLGGEAVLDPGFEEKTEFLSALIAEHPVDHLILTTNGYRLNDPEFVSYLVRSRIDAVNLSRMHWDQERNDRIFGRKTRTEGEIRRLYGQLRSAGKTLRLNVNVWRGNLDSPGDMERFVQVFRGACDAVKFTPLMSTEMFGTVPEVTEFTREKAIPEEEIGALWEAFLSRHSLLRRASRVLGFVDYAEAEVFGQRVILKYAQVEDKYDPGSEIPTLKLYPNGCLSNVWSSARDIRSRADAAPEES